MAAISISGSWESWHPEVLYVMVREANHRAAEHVVKEAQRNISTGGHTDTGRLGRSFVIEESRFGLLGTQFTVSNTAPYAGYVDQGTYGPIYPRSASVLRFKAGKSNARNRGARGRFVATPSEYLYRPYVNGQPATHFFTNAVNGLSLRDFIL